MNINLLLVLALFNMTSVRSGRVLVALYALDLGAQSFAVGLLSATFAIFPGVLSWPIGMMADRVGSRWPLMLGTCGLAFAALIPYFFPGIPALFAATALIGLSFSFYNVSTQNLIGLLGRQHEHTRNFSNFSVVQSIASIAGSLLIGFGIDHAGYGPTCLALAFFSLPAIVLLVVRGGGLPGATHDGTSTGSVLHTLKDPAMWRVLGTGSLVVSGIELYQFYMPVYGHAIELSASAIGFILAMFSAASLAVRLIMPWLFRRFSNEQVLDYSFCAAAVSLALMPFFTSVPVLAFMSFLFGLGMGCGQPITMAMAFTNSASGRSGEIMGLRVTVNNLTRVVVPVVFGSLGAAFGWFAVFWVNSLMLGSGALIKRPGTDVPADRH